MDKILEKTLARLEAIENSLELVHTFLANHCSYCNSQTLLKAESQKDTVDLPKSDPE